MTNFLQDAIEAALSQKWDSAIKINKEILKENKDDVDTLCRLAYAYQHTGEIERAKKIYKKILSLDKFHAVAVKNLQKLNSATDANFKSNSRRRVPPSLFIEEPGKTKTVQLINLAPSKTINKLSIGDLVILFAKKHSVEVRDEDKTYFGALPDDVAFRLIKFMDAGNTYLAAIKNLNKNFVSVFIREMTRGKKLQHQSTFTPSFVKEFNPSIQREIKKRVVDENEIEENQESDEE